MKTGQVMFIAGLLLLLIVVAGSQSRIPAQQTATTKTQVISYTYTTTTSVSGTVTTTTSTSATTVTSIQQTTTSVTTLQPTTTSSQLASTTTSSSSSQTAGTPSSITIQISLPQAPQTGLTQSQIVSLTVTVSGRVLDQYGNGVPNVYVNAFSGDFIYESGTPNTYQPNYLYNVNPAKTDSNGNYVLNVPLTSLINSKGKIGVVVGYGQVGVNVGYQVNWGYIPGYGSFTDTVTVVGTATTCKPDNCYSPANYLYSDIYQISMNVVPEKNLYALFVDPYSGSQIDMQAYVTKTVTWLNLIPNPNYYSSPSIGTGSGGTSCPSSSSGFNVAIYTGTGAVAVGVNPQAYNGGTMIWNFCDGTSLTFKNIVIQTGINPWSPTNPTYPIFYDQNGNQQTPLFDLTSASLSKVKSGGTQQAIVTLSLIPWNDNPLGIGIPTAEIFLILAFLLMISGALTMYRDREI